MHLLDFQIKYAYWSNELEYESYKYLKNLKKNEVFVCWGIQIDT